MGTIPVDGQVMDNRERVVGVEALLLRLQLQADARILRDVLRVGVR